MNNTPKTRQITTATAITASAIIAISTLSLTNALPGTVINEIIDQFSLVGTGEGLMISMLNVGFMSSLLIIPMVQGRINKNYILITACAIQAIFLFTSATSPNFTFFCAMWVLIGVVSGFLDTYSNSCIVDARGKDSPKYLGYLHGMYGIASLIAPVAIYALLQYMNWRGIYSVIAAISILAAPVIFMLTRKRSQGRAGTEADTNTDADTAMNEQRFRVEDLKTFMRKKRNIMLSVTTFTIIIAQYGTQAWIVRFMTVEHDAASLGALSISLFWVCATFNRLVLSRFISKAPMKFFILGAVLTSVFTIIGVVSVNAVVMCVMIAATGLAGGHFIPVLISEAAKGFEGKTTFTTSLLMFIMGIGRIITPLGMAFISAWIAMSLSMAIPIIAAALAALFGWLTLKAEA